MSADGKLLPAKGLPAGSRKFPAGKASGNDIFEMLRSLRGMKSVACEGGTSLCRKLLDADAVDELHLTVMPVILGGAATPSLTGLPSEFLPEERRFKLLSFTPVKRTGECVLRYQRVRKNAPGVHG